MADNSARTGEAGALNNARDTIRAKAADLASQAKERVEEQFDSKLGTARGEIGSIASALRRVGDQIRHENGSSITASLFGAAADRVETLGSSFEGKDLDGVLNDVTRLARRNPAAFAGTAAALGFLAARFLKSSGSSWKQDHEESLVPYEQSRAGFDYTPGSGSNSGLSSTGYGTGSMPETYGTGAAPKAPGSGSGFGSGGV